MKNVTLFKQFFNNFAVDYEKRVEQAIAKLKTGREQFGNALILTFAGHDTTANTLTWIIFELCRNREHYDKLKCEGEFHGYF